MMAHMGRLRPKWGTFFRLQAYIYDRVGVSLVEVYERVGNSVVSVIKRS